jgi:hypothetical protein
MRNNIGKALILAVGDAAAVGGSFLNDIIYLFKKLLAGLFWQCYRVFFRLIATCLQNGSSDELKTLEALLYVAFFEIFWG